MSRYFVVSTVFLTLLIGSLMIDGSVIVAWSWYAGLISLFLIITGAGVLFPRLDYFFQTTRFSDPAGGVALTFNADNTDTVSPVLAILDTYKIPATFFCSGVFVKRYPETIKQIIEAGSLLGNYGYNDRAGFSFSASSVITKALADTDHLIFKTSGKHVKNFRSPTRFSTPMLAKAIKRRNYKIIGFSKIFSVGMQAELFSNWLDHVKEGDIILCKQTDPDQVSLLITALKTRGFIFARVDELLKQRGSTP
ncbi:MAG TPA: polysaccharide deacetylase family protein [Ohtaekwangia sp.]|nr:polysaccharide deacetylase family protein [Ohtaekwangia sp.]